MAAEINIHRQRINDSRSSKQSNRDEVTVDKQHKKKKKIKIASNYTNDSWNKYVPEEDLPLINEIETIIAPRKVMPVKYEFKVKQPHEITILMN
ncbi:hypothetical protein ACJMK2_022500 [Sinanodonta woodiana]|uniref:Uncharacterized protein n=1 Tax=Sinanodonta woodiana TaxID=1069815 RepID=A0ABD3TJC3_SINWO